jgi:alkanesulfonate monooxygenase SsuD/methylene tetrahydromethanopterin reductase-like flavin-dependent oxidoreductase (luciferase family)
VPDARPKGNGNARAGAAPEVLIPRVAALTREMRVGSGGVMLSHYSPLKVAEQFRMLATLFPDRIDLGIGAIGAETRAEAMKG